MAVVVPTQKTPFLTKKLKDRRGKFQKDNSKGFSGGASGRVRPLALGLSLRSSAFTLEIGSSFGVNCHHIRLFNAWRVFLIFLDITLILFLIIVFN